jgi:hypothetical protein
VCSARVCGLPCWVSLTPSRAGQRGRPYQQGRAARETLPAGQGSEGHPAGCLAPCSWVSLPGPCSWVSLPGPCSWVSLPGPLQLGLSAWPLQLGLSAWPLQLGLSAWPPAAGSLCLGLPGPLMSVRRTPRSTRTPHAAQTRLAQTRPRQTRLHPDRHASTQTDTPPRRDSHDAWHALCAPPTRDSHHKLTRKLTQFEKI